MKVIGYFESGGDPHWLGEILKSDWRAGPFLVSLIREGRFFEAAGEGSEVLLLTEEDELISYCTFAEKDDVQPTELTPWIGFVYTFPRYRGHGYIGLLFDEVERRAREAGIGQVYLSTNHIGLYEKYGFEFYGMMDDMDGNPSRIYLKRFAPDVRLAEITEDNWLAAARLAVKDEQKGFVAPAVGIIARGYVYRDCRAKVYVIGSGNEPAGLALVREFDSEPFGYDLQQFMIDARYQKRGIGSAALKLILDKLKAEGRYDHVELCVKKADTEAIKLYEKHGFVDSGYVDDDVPDSVNMILYL